MLRWKQLNIWLWWTWNILVEGLFASAAVFVEELISFLFLKLIRYQFGLLDFIWLWEVLKSYCLSSNSLCIFYHDYPTGFKSNSNNCKDWMGHGLICFPLFQYSFRRPISFFATSYFICYSMKHKWEWPNMHLKGLTIL